jgi:hypothetical protein
MDRRDFLAQHVIGEKIKGFVQLEVAIDLCCASWPALLAWYLILMAFGTD